MKTVRVKAVKPAKSENIQEQKPQTDSVGLSFKQIDERAFARTEVLDAILEEEEKASWRHWGLNE